MQMQLRQLINSPANSKGKERHICLHPYLGLTFPIKKTKFMNKRGAGLLCMLLYSSNKQQNNNPRTE